ncbi:DUF222 domain-containing protein [Geodermatophilus sp. SYSU D01036]
MDDVLTAPLPVAPAIGMSSGPLGVVQAADRNIARQTALRARAVAEFAASRPSSGDRPQDAPGAMSAERWAARPEVLRPVSEWATQELAVALSLSSEAAQALLERSLTLVHRLPATLDALEAGALHPGHLWPLLDEVAPITDDTVRAGLERDLLAWATGRVTTPAQLGDKARREVLQRGARAAADRLARAVRERGVSARPDRTDGMSVVGALLTTPEAAALVKALGAYADALPDDGRTRGQRMADCLLDLVLRPGEHGLPPVQVRLDVVAPVGALLGGDQPCQIDGQVVPAEVVRALLTALTGTPLVTGTEPKGTDPEAIESEISAPEATAPTADGGVDNSTSGSSATVPTPADTTATDAAPVEFATDADDWPLLGLTAADIAHYESEADELSAWWDRMEARVLAGEFDDRPVSCPVDEEPPPGLVPPPDESPPPDDSAPPPTDSPPRAAVPEGWWARADRAVDDAGDAVLAARRALGHAARMVATAERAATADETVWTHSPAGRVTAAPDALTALGAATQSGREALAGLLRRTAGGGLADRPRLVLTDALTGALLTLTDLPALHRADRTGTGLSVPGPSAGYHPGAALDRHGRARDRRCRFPGCRRRTGHLDHAIPWPAGPTAAPNLAGYCAGHHRGKHQAPGWHHRLAPDGTLTVTTPTGLTATTTPPPY